MIRWSPSVDRKSRKFSLRFSQLTLFPPFLQKESRRLFSEAIQLVTPKKVRTTRRLRSKKQEIVFDDYISTCKSRVDDSLGENDVDPQEERQYVLCKDECRTKIITCEDLRDIITEKTKSFTKTANDELHVAFDLLAEDYQQEDEEYEEEEKFEDETDRDEQKEETRSWVSDRCESFSSLSENEEEPNTTDPCLSHELYLPYNKIQRPRYFQSTSIGPENITVRLLRRPRSPVRQILPDKFNLKIAYEEWDRKRRFSKRRKYLAESKERISQSIRRLSSEGFDEHTLISSMVLQVVCEQVTLTLMNVDIDINIQTFVNIAVIWALYELDIFDYGALLDENDVLPENRQFFNWKQQDIIDIMGTGGMRKILTGAYRAPFSRNIFTSLHRRLPWPYVSPSHERGHTKFYPNVRERIDEKISGESEEREHTLTHVPDLTCFHLREVLDKSYVAYRRKSKSFVLRLFSVEEKNDLFVQLLSFM